MSTRNKIILVGMANVSLLARLEKEFLNKEIKVIEDLKDLKKEDIDFKIERAPDMMQPKLLPSIRSIDMGDMGNSYPTPHKSSRRSKKW